MSSAAVRAGRARLEAFRAARARGRREDEAREDDDDADASIIPAVETTAPSTTRGLEPSEDARATAIDADARATAEDAPREPRESTTTEDGGWDAGERRGVDGARARTDAAAATLDAPATSAFTAASSSASSGYFALADAYVEANAAETRVEDDERGEQKNVLSATTSTDRAREQYERVMRAISQNDAIDSSLFDDPRFDDGRRANEEEEEEEAREQRSSSARNWTQSSNGCARTVRSTLPRPSFETIRAKLSCCRKSSTS